MQRLHVAAPQSAVAALSAKWDEQSAGAWRHHVRIHKLQEAPAKRTENDNMVSQLAASQSSPVYVSQHLVSRELQRSFGNVRRYRKWELGEAVSTWLRDSDLDWRARTSAHCAKTPFKCLPADEWVAQFERVAPGWGRRAGAALLAQFRVFGQQEFADFFSGLPLADYHTYFIGADPHSGDHGLVPVLASHYDGKTLCDEKRLPKLKSRSKLRLHCDAAWSGGEMQRRLSCLYTSCSKKANAISKDTHLEVRLGFLTDVAEKKIQERTRSLIAAGIANDGFIRITHPVGNRYTLVGDKSGQRGLAFHDLTLLNYVSDDAKALRKLCLKIGAELAPDRELGTNEVASCIAFFHSLPKAMLPVFIVDGALVTDSDGERFTWQALLRSRHISNAAPELADHHCTTCPLSER